MSEDKATNRKKILIAEDEQDLREALQTIIESEGYEVLTAENGREALDTALREHPDLILLDLMMPHMTGQEVLNELHKDEWGVTAKVVVLTASADMETLSEVLQKGGHDYLIKSDWQLEEVIEKINAKLN